MVLLLVSMNDYAAFYHFEAFLLDFYCCLCRLTSFYFITLFFVSDYLIMGINNMMIYSNNSDVAVVRRPYSANYCFVYRSLTSSFLFLFILFLLFFYFVSSVLLILLLLFWYRQLTSCLLSLTVEYIFILLPDPVEI